MSEHRSYHEAEREVPVAVLAFMVATGRRPKQSRWQAMLARVRRWLRR